MSFVLTVCCVCECQPPILSEGSEVILGNSSGYSVKLQTVCMNCQAILAREQIKYIVLRKSPPCATYMMVTVGGTFYMYMYRSFP